MIKELDKIVNIVNGDFIGEKSNLINNVSIDTRTLNRDDIYFALKGENFDGHSFIAKAFENGASVVVISKEFFKDNKENILEQNKSFIIVEDTLKALHDLAREYRKQYDIPVVAITGSSGKTSTKDMVASVLSQKFNVLKTEGNFNNEIGLPLTLFKLNSEHEVVVLEMGMRGLKEIELLCKIALPTAGIITNVGISHMELLGSEKNIAKAKGELLENISKEGFCLLNAENKWTTEISKLSTGEVLTFGFKDDCHIKATNLVKTSEGSSFLLHINNDSVKIKLPLPGDHNVLNALSAAGIGYKLGMKLNDIKEGLAKVKLSAMRLAKVKGFNESIIINDAYNANPDSTKASLKVLAEEKKNRLIAVLGHMRELGDLEINAHREIGKYTYNLNIDYLITVGKLGKEIAKGAIEAGMNKERVFVFEDNKEAKVFLKDLLEKDDTVLIKASRAVKFEEIVEYVSCEGDY